MKTGFKLLFSCSIFAIITILFKERTLLDKPLIKGYMVSNFKTKVTTIKSNDIFNIKMKPDLMNLINPPVPKFALTVNGSYLLEDTNLCSSVSNLSILIMVLSATHHFKRRKAIRQTWANESVYSSYGTIKVLFLLGLNNDANIQGNIEREFKLYGDIVQGPFIDSYHNLSHKSVMGYKWLTERCRNAKFVIKTDDDIVINMFQVLQKNIHMLSVYQHHVLCRLLDKSIFRNKRNKYYVVPNQFKGMNYFPTYCNGQFVMMLNDIVPYIYESASQTPLFWIADVYIYGIVMNNIPALKFKHIKEFGTYKNNKSKNCLEQKKSNCRYIYHATENSSQILDIWSAIIKQYI